MRMALEVGVVRPVCIRFRPNVNTASHSRQTTQQIAGPSYPQAIGKVVHGTVCWSHNLKHLLPVTESSPVDHLNYKEFENGLPYIIIQFPSQVLAKNGLSSVASRFPLSESPL